MSASSLDNVLSSTVTTTTTVSTQSNAMASVTTELSHTAALAIADPLSHVGDGIFLQTKTAKGLAGICVWVALFITCQQVRNTFNHCLLHAFYFHTRQKFAYFSKKSKIKINKNWCDTFKVEFSLEMNKNNKMLIQRKISQNRTKIINWKKENNKLKYEIACQILIRLKHFRVSSSFLGYWYSHYGNPIIISHFISWNWEQTSTTIL